MMGSGHSWKYKPPPSCVKLQWCGGNTIQGSIFFSWKAFQLQALSVDKNNNCCFNRQRQIDNKRNRRLGYTGRQLSPWTDWTAKTYTKTTKWEICQWSKYKHAVKTTKWQITGWMDWWRADWGMWKWWINEWMWENRLTYQLKDKWSSVTGCRGTLTQWPTGTDSPTHMCSKNAVGDP